MRKKSKIFNAKILLFGEYTVILDSKALTIPYTYFTGRLSYIGDDKYTRYDQAQKSNRDLFSYLDYLKLHQEKKSEYEQLDLPQLENDLKEGLHFESNIPQGYGVGSSGALVAAIYMNYARFRIKPADRSSILKLKKIFSDMETFFHGRSSGLDPLNSYVGKPLLINTVNDISIVSIPNQTNNADGAVFLINTGSPSDTEPLVNLFIEKTKDTPYRRILSESYIPINNHCIDQISNGDIIGFFESLNKLSVLQLKIFSEMIPERFVEIWNYGLESKEYIMKLCGSGGGGFLLGFTRDYKSVEEQMKNRDIEIIPVFKNSVFRRTN